MPVLPGSSYRVSNDLVIARRRLLRLEPPVRISFDSSWEEGNILFDWYGRRSSQFIDRIQLRKESESPFFHEYIVFGLHDNGGYFRVDRRQRPDEDIPLDCIYKGGVEAQDTIEQVTSLEDETYCPSTCLIDVTLRFHAPLAMLLSAVWAIRDQPDSSVYTLQRYNCYFFAQTILLCLSRVMVQIGPYSNPAPKAYEGHLNRVMKPHVTEVKGKIRASPRLRIRPAAKASMEHGAANRKLIEHGSSSLWPNCHPGDRRSLNFWRQFGHSVITTRQNASTTILVNTELARVGLESAPSSQEQGCANAMQLSNYEEMHNYIGKLIDAHSARVEHYKMVLGCTKVELSKDIKSTMYDVWELINGIPQVDDEIESQSVARAYTPRRGAGPSPSRHTEA